MSNGGTPIKLDCSNLRTQRQKLNNKNINEILKGDDLSRTKLNKLCNDKSLQRVLNELKEYFPKAINILNLMIVGFTDTRTPLIWDISSLLIEKQLCNRFPIIILRYCKAKTFD